MNVKKDILWRVLVSIFMLVFLAAAILYSTVKIQYGKGDYWLDLDDSLHQKMLKVPAIRGSIYSEDGSLLATSVPIYQVSIDFGVIKEFHKDSFEQYKPLLAKNLCNTLKNRTYEEYLDILTKGYRATTRYKTIIRNASFIQVKEMRGWPIFLNGKNKGGLIVQEETKRKKPYLDLMARTIGFVNENHHGAGIEASFDSVLSGVDGEQYVRRIVGGYEPVEDEFSIKPENGKDIYTTIDIHLQDIVSENLSNSILANGAEFGTAILLEVSTGKIKAISNINQTPEGLFERFNHAIGTNYEPGSTIKLVSALACLDNGGVELEDSVEVNYGKYKFFGRDEIEDVGHGSFKKLTYRQVFEKSSNVGISRTAYDVFGKSPEKFIEYFDELHLTTPLETGMNGEAHPKILRPGKPGWSGMGVPSTSIGYSVAMSPLHVAMLYNAVANNGKMMKPYLISKIGSLGMVDATFEPTVIESKICKSSTLKDLRALLEGVVQNGTATDLKNLPFTVAGKTGTARISGAAGYEKNAYNSSFIGYFPADKPQYTLLVLVSRPTKGRYYGAAVALPVFKEIAKNIYANAVREPLPKADTGALPKMLCGTVRELKEVTSLFDLDADFDSKNREFIILKPDTDELIERAIQFNGNKMPNIEGMSLRDCLVLFENEGFKLNFSGYGKVYEQWPNEGTALIKGQNVYVKLRVKP
ncbi:MAG: transpeptidase family protein [Flavobacteriales bacterium]|nr:transpeptidase family protein [Flavobacteriales bacterium]